MAPWQPDWASFTPEERTLATIVQRMDRIRAAVHTAGDLVRLAEVDDWFRKHAPSIRAIREKLEPPF